MLESTKQWMLTNPSQTPQFDLHISPVIKRMLAKRGIHTQEEAEAFLYLNLNDLHDPFLFNDMEKVVKRINLAIDREEKILIYGDYDADGVTSTAVLVHTLRSMGALVDYYIPNRFTEGYGPNEAAFREVKEAGGSLIITVDNGIAAPYEAKIAKEIGIDLIITDHHEEQDELPDAYGIIHPRLAPDYPFNDLAGVGVAFKLAHALLGELPKHLLGLVAIGTVADLVPLKGENRVFVKHGLSILSNSEHPGINALKKIGKIDQGMTTDHIGFIIGPRLNAVGRLQDASLAVDLLLEEDEILAEDIALEIDQLNQERQQIVKKLADEAIKEIEAYHRDDYVFVLAKEGWNPGVLGIVASRIVNKYYRPTIVLGIDEQQGIAKGSGRSIPAYDLFKQGMEVNDLFLQFGGHAQAAGMTVEIDQIDELRRQLNEQAKDKLQPDDFIPTLSIEDEVDWSEVDLNFPNEIQLLAPFGMGNEKPVFQVNDIQLKEIRKIGANQNHIKLKGNKGDESIEMIGFKLGHLADQLSPGVLVDAVGEIEINEWNGHRKLQIKLQDLRCNEWQLFDCRGQKLVNQIVEKLPNDETLVVYTNEQPSIKSVEIHQYNQLQEDIVKDIKHLVCVDLPERLTDFEKLLNIGSFTSIYLCYQNQSQQLFSPMPNREDFKILYSTLKKHQVIKEQQKKQLAQAKNWTIDCLDFMLQVFFELNFVKINHGEIIFQDNVEFKPLNQSITYQRKHELMKVEETLYYSSYTELKEWIGSRLSVSLQSKEGEVVHGL
ncbi:single-stranded-DNA-specific exonuclease RecJ [Alkalibacillus aidingensis]|uniref:single-stranded-DNA-specific exonuclease RecJ n=1 Tax=Alkalibacillus aidingensis TaxID=2747607 RepID=UPI00166051B9|nr:single-stranded-DNA-specific exonuclease RecJ [Alkalibacillus aidingensis]